MELVSDEASISELQCIATPTEAEIRLIGEAALDSLSTWEEF